MCARSGCGLCAESSRPVAAAAKDARAGLRHSGPVGHQVLKHVQAFDFGQCTGFACRRHPQTRLARPGNPAARVQFLNMASAFIISWRPRLRWRSDRARQVQAGNKLAVGFGNIRVVGESAELCVAFS